MPVVNGIQTEFKDRLQVVQLDFDDPKNRDAVTALHVRAHPTIVLISRKGEVTRTWLGAITERDLRPLVEDLLRQ